MSMIWFRRLLFSTAWRERSQIPLLSVISSCACRINRPRSGLGMVAFLLFYFDTGAMPGMSVRTT